MPLLLLLSHAWADICIDQPLASSNSDFERPTKTISWAASFCFHQEIPQKKGNTVSKILTEVLDANARYSANFGAKAGLAMPPARSFAILTCMDARLDPAKYAGL